VKQLRWLFMAGFSILLMGTLHAAGNTTENQKRDMLNILGCTNQWDFTVYAHSLRLRGKNADAARAELIRLWDAPGEKEYSDLIRGSVNRAVDFVYAEKKPVSKFSQIVISANDSLGSCVQKQNITLYYPELQNASHKASLATLWDYHRRRGAKKEQILSGSKKMSEGGRKILDDVYSDKFDIRVYRIRSVWNPTMNYISEKYHGRTLRRER